MARWSQPARARDSALQADAVPLFRSMGARARSLPCAIDRDSRRSAHLRRARQRRRVVAGASCFASTRPAARQSSPGCLRTTSVRPVSYGATRTTTGRASSRPATRGGSIGSARMLTLVDRVRLDHFRGFVAAWEVPHDATSAIHGEWRPGPGASLLEAIRTALAIDRLPFVAENLGVITPEVEALRNRFGFPGMAILQFAFGSDPQAPGFRPHNYQRNLVVYTGTHDNDTTIGWWTGGAGHSTRSQADIARERDYARRYLRARRQRRALGVHTQRAGVCCRYGDRSRARRSGSGQRSADESAGDCIRQLALAAVSRSIHSGSRAAPRHSDRNVRAPLETPLET